MIERIINTAKNLGACSNTAKATDWRSLAWLLFSPQGREFCQQKNYPDPEMWHDIKLAHDTRPYGIYIDSGTVEIVGKRNVALIGRTKGLLEFRNPESIHRVILMHGAKAKIRASNYAVVAIVRIGSGSEVEIDKDETSIILWE